MNRLLLALAWGALPACAPSGPERPSVLLLTLDTTRYDALGCYGNPQASTPVLDALASEGILYERAYTSAPITLPAHASLLTGLYPIRHGVRNNGLGALASEADTLAERAAAHGYQTAAAVGAVVLDSAFGLGQGFDLYDVPAKTAAEPRRAERPAWEVVDVALEWLQERDRSKPFLLWAHFYDPHTPYAPPEEFRADNLSGNYLGEVSLMDREIGRLLAGLRDQGVDDNTIVVAVGDHGESFGEHDEHAHSVHCYETTLRVPLIVRWPGGRGAGTRSDDIVSVVDLFPTLLEALDWGAPPDIDGRSFYSAPLPDERGIYFESYYGFLSFGWSPIAGWLDGRGKTIQSADPRFFDLATDPGETVDRKDERSEVLEEHRRNIGALAGRKTLKAESTPVDPKLMADLRALGYATVGAEVTDLPHPLAPTELPSPASMTALYEESLDAVELGRQGEFQKALEIFERVLAANPKNPFVLEQLATCQIRLDRVENAIVTLRRLLKDAPSASPDVWLKLGVCLRSVGRFDEAVEALQQAVALDPQRPRILRELGSALQDAGREEEARETFELLRRVGG